MQTESGPQQWHLWETDYPECGSVTITAWTPKGARRKYRKLTKVRAPLPELVELSTVPCHPL